MNAFETDVLLELLLGNAQFLPRSRSYCCTRSSSSVLDFRHHNC